MENKYRFMCNLPLKTASFFFLFRLNINITMCKTELAFCLWIKISIFKIHYLLFMIINNTCHIAPVVFEIPPHGEHVHEGYYYYYANASYLKFFMRRAGYLLLLCRDLIVRSKH